MNVEIRTVDPFVFHLTGKRPGDGLGGSVGLRPALFAAYRDLTQLRYDFPLILIEGKSAGAPVRSLSSIVDDLLRKIAPPGMESEQLRKMILQLESNIRALAAGGERGLLSDLWDKVALRFEQTDKSFGKSARIARAALDVDGEVLDCHPAMASRLVTHLWSTAHEDKARKFRATASRLAVKLADILRADFLRSQVGRQPEALKKSIGQAHHELFDFAAMSRLLPKSAPHESLPETRRQRVESALAVLKKQKFFATWVARAKPEPATQPHSFTFASCAEALAAFRARLPELVELVKALSIAELEIDGTYDVLKHNAYFAGFDAASLSAKDLALFPDYLITLDGVGTAADGLMEALSSGVPLKVLANIHDLIEESSIGNGHIALGLRSAQLASMGVGIGEIFVLQSSSSNLYQMRDRVLRGLAYDGPALFSVFSGAAPQDGSPPAYLIAAAAMQSRAFPAFSYDPSAGAQLASRFSLENNPQPDSDWTIENFEYADDEMQRIKQDAKFTFVDFLICDPRYERHFAHVERGQWNDRLVPVAQWMSSELAASSDSAPYVLAVDGNSVLMRLVVDDKAVAAARRCLENWHRLQELGGVHNSYADRLLKREKAAWEEQKRHELECLASVTKPEAALPPTAPVQPAAASVPEPEAKAPEHSLEEAYIETERCSTCNECTQINDRMFVYNDNKQAYIADINAGTYQQLVEAAENCQLGIVHPGKPRDKDEPGLDELMKRAEAFL